MPFQKGGAFFLLGTQSPCVLSVRFQLGEFGHFRYDETKARFFVALGARPCRWIIRNRLSF